ncbi:MAG: hypothetical protein ACRC9R_03910, partial [Enterovibrio sp.]
TIPTVNATASATATTSSALMSALIAPQSAQATMRQADVMTVPASSSTPAVAAQQMLSNLPALAVSASSTTQQETQSNIVPPVFTAPIASSSVTAAQLAPVLPPFTQSAPESCQYTQIDDSSGAGLGALGVSYLDMGDFLRMNEESVLALLTEEQRGIMHSDEDAHDVDGETEGK